MNGPRVAVVILNYNGRKLLEQFLPAVLQHSQGSLVYVVDNASTDDSISYLRASFPQVKCIQLARNYGFAQGYNEGLKEIAADYYVLLNSDVEVTPNWIQPVVDLMEGDHSISACQPKLLAYHDKAFFEYAGASGGFIDKYGYPFCRGRMFSELEKDEGQYNDTREVFWATGACLFVRARVYHQLGGFDGSYFAHMEEIDLCWRMKNTGHRVVVAPSSVVYHVGGGTLNKISPRKTYLNFRNNLLTITKNYPNRFWLDVLVVRLVLDGIAGIKFCLEGRPLHTFAVVRGHFAYYWRLPSVLRKRKAMRTLPNYQASTTGMYQANIVREFYLRKKRKFSDLSPKDFSV